MEFKKWRKVLLTGAAALALAACGSQKTDNKTCLLYTSPSPRDLSTSRMPSSA